MSSVAGVDVEYSGKLAIIRLNRPKVKNAINGVCYIGLTKILNEISENEKVTITVITGTGDFYSSGNDLAAVMDEFSNSDDDSKTRLELNIRVKNLVAAFINHSKILVAFVNGPALGIAATTLALCDIVYCVDNAYFLTPFTNLGLCCEGCSSYTFPRIFGPSLASEILYLNKKVTAQEALKAGFVSQIYSMHDINNKVLPVLQQNAEQLSATSLKKSKELVRMFDKEIMHKVNENECQQLLELTGSEESSQAIMRFFANRRSKL